ncbi:MAG TPA: hypothetical protein VET83_02210 [Candidatus Dormibacteraeota bacterium]|nr:hypothetical protein [Candidatus Dormibacteraeota bacterium]
MPLQRFARSLGCIAMAGIALAFLGSCAKNPLRLDKNRPPRTYLVAAPIDSTISHPAATGVSYSYRVHMYWRGEDPDGYVVGFLWSFDDSSAGHLHYTAKTDSIFDLTVNDSTDILGGATIIGFTRFHTFYIKAVDNLGKADPNFAVFNRTTFKASTIKPAVRFVYPFFPPFELPSRAATDSGQIDTLSDGQPFKVAWTGNDSDGVVIRYKLDVGNYHGALTSDTSAVFNDINDPKSIGLSSGIYNLTITAVDNAYAVGKTNFLFVVNHDPETWFEPKGNPNGYYSPPFINGEAVDPSLVFTFSEGDTVPYRSTVWFNWDGEDLGRPGTKNNPTAEGNCVDSYSLELRNGTHAPSGGVGGEPYVIGFVDSIQGSPPRPFKSNEPNYLRQAGRPNFVLDSLDAGFNMIMLAASHDCSGRGDGTKAALQFNCNYRPFMDSLVVTCSNTGPPQFIAGKLITWYAHDVEDGPARSARIQLDEILAFDTADAAVDFFVADSTFARLRPGSPTHSVRVWARDRAGFLSDSSLVVEFPLVCPDAVRTARRK